MKYGKGTFITIPNKTALYGLESGAQALYMWLCDYANTEGDCFPSRATLAERLGCTVKTVDGYLNSLIEVGLVVKENRFKDNEKISNNYHLPLGGRVKITPPRVKITLPVGQNLPIELNPVLTQPNNMEAELPVEVVDERKKPDLGYKEVFGIFSPRMEGWMNHKPQIEAAKRLLKSKGLEHIKTAMERYKEIKPDSLMMIDIDTPYDLEAKWHKLVKL